MQNSHIAFWFRRDLRLDDNKGLFAALTDGRPVVPVFIFDREILDELPQKDARVEFIHQKITHLQEKITEAGSSIVVKYGFPEQIWEELIEEYNLEAIYTNHDYEPYALQRDEQIKHLLNKSGGSFHTFKDQVIFEREEILTQAGSPYTVFTPYSRTWKDSLNPDNLRSVSSEEHPDSFFKSNVLPIPTLSEMGFEPAGLGFPSSFLDEDLVSTYDETRDYPAQNGTSRLGIHLRFGTISIRKLVKKALKLNQTYLNELIWREFYMQILANFPYVVNGPFREKYAAIPWRNDEEEFKAWCEGKTGYPLVDAGMRQLNETGYMHNRVRMVVASFLTKHLLINWQWGEAYFAEKLLDYELASNNGGWQWAAGCGTDAAPYFRVFNPESQLKKFDPKAKYVRRWVPEFGTPTYPAPIVEHKFARERCLDTYKSTLSD